MDIKGARVNKITTSALTRVVTSEKNTFGFSPTLTCSYLEDNQFLQNIDVLINRVLDGYLICLEVKTQFLVVYADFKTTPTTDLDRYAIAELTQIAFAHARSIFYIKTIEEYSRGQMLPTRTIEQIMQDIKNGVLAINN